MWKPITNGAFKQFKTTPLLQFQRYRGKINIQRPRPPHYDRALVLAVTSPSFPERLKTNCFEKRSQILVDNPYNDIIAREVRNYLDLSKMVGIFHLNSIKSDDFFDVRVQLHKHSMSLKVYGRSIMKKAVEDSPYEAILPLFGSKHCLVFSKEEKLSQLIKVTRKVPQMILLASIVDNTLLSRNESMDYARIPNLQTVQAELVSTINTAASNMIKTFDAQKSKLVNIMDAYSSLNTINK